MQLRLKRISLFRLSVHKYSVEITHFLQHGFRTASMVNGGNADEGNHYIAQRTTHRQKIKGQYWSGLYPFAHSGPKANKLFGNRTCPIKNSLPPRSAEGVSLLQSLFEPDEEVHLRSQVSCHSFRNKRHRH